MLKSINLPSTAHRLVKASIEVERLETLLKEAKRAKEDLANRVSEEYQEGDVRSQKIEVDGKSYTVYRRRDISASVLAGNQPQLVSICRSMGLDELVKTEVPTAKVKSYIVELARGDDPADEYDWDAVPEELRSLVNIYETVKAIVKKG